MFTSSVPTVGLRRVAKWLERLTAEQNIDGWDARSPSSK